MQDRFGNPIDPMVGYARGRILATATEEGMRLAHCQVLVRQRVAALGPESIGIFTGNRRDFLARPDDLALLAEEWVGGALLTPELDAAIRAHLAAPAGAATAVMNRGSAVLVAAACALAEGSRILSRVPAKERCHPSLRRGAAWAGAVLEEVDSSAALEAALAQPTALLVVTPVTSSLARMPEDEIAHALAAARACQVTTLVDDAYGARLRTILHDGAPAFTLGARLVVTNADKAGLPGPRAGILAGDPALVARIAARGAEAGQEARAPAALGVLRGLEAFDPEELRREAQEGQVLAGAMAARLGDGAIKRTDLGPLLAAEETLAIALHRAGRNASTLVPVEATAILGMLLLRDHGVLTTNVAGQPGSHSALRLKPAGPALQRCGGVAAVAAAVDGALDRLAGLLAEPAAARALLLG